MTFDDEYHNDSYFNVILVYNITDEHYLKNVLKCFHKFSGGFFILS